MLVGSHSVSLMGRSEVPLIRDDALAALRAAAGQGFGFDPWDAPTTPPNRAALDRWRAWAAAQTAER